MLHGLQRRALAKAFHGQGSRPWLIVGTAAWLLRTANRLRSKQPQTVYLEALAPGERLVIDHLPPPATSRRARRQARS
ncbi:MAG: hypothetical protein ACLFRV_12190 [Acidimicrobiales bacterium]